MLRGMRVLVTRPSPQGEKLCEQIQAQGGEATHFPTIAFAPPPDQAAYESALQQLGEQSWLIFISPQAVYASVPELRRHWPVFPEKTKFAAIGAGTSAALREAGYRVAVQPAQEWTSEGFLALPAFQAIEGEKIAVIRGEGGRELIDKTLKERGAVLLPVIAYRRVLPAVRLDLTQYTQFDTIVCTSADTLLNLKALAGEAGWPLIRDARVIVMSNRVKLIAQEAGFGQICVTQSASNDAIIDLMVQEKRSDDDKASQ